MKVYILFTTDVYRSRKSTICYGVFSSRNNAIDTAKQNNLYTDRVEVLIVECEIDKFEEI